MPLLIERKNTNPHAAAAKNEPFSYVFGAMTTQCELQFYGLSPAENIALALAIEARVADLVKRFNFHAADSWLTKAVNQRRHQRVALDAETTALLAQVYEHSRLTCGAFDITVGTAANRLKLAQTVAEVAQAHRQSAPYRGLEHWWLDAQTLCFDNPITRFDLGGVIKEYAVDVSVSMARAAGVTAGLINYGGDLYAIGVKPVVAHAPSQRFIAAVVNPLAPSQMLFGLDLEDQALTTSAHYARNRILKATNHQPAERLSHIVATANAALQRSPPRWISATVVSNSTLVSGIYSTALLIKDDLRLPPGVTALVVDANGHLSSMIGAN